MTGAPGRERRCHYIRETGQPGEAQYAAAQGGTPFGGGCLNNPAVNGSVSSGPPDLSVNPTPGWGGTVQRATGLAAMPAEYS